MFGEAQSPGGAVESHALDFVFLQNPVLWDVAWFSFVPDGTHFVSRPFYPPINQWAIFFRPCGTYWLQVAPVSYFPCVNSSCSFVMRFSRASCAVFKHVLHQESGLYWLMASSAYCNARA